MTRKAGKRGGFRESHEPRLDASQFVSSAVAGYLQFDVSHGFENWGMDGNDVYGDCGFAAMDHYNVAKMGTQAVIGKFGFPQYDTLIDAYFAYGIAQGEPGPHPDQGVSNATMLAWAYNERLIDGYGEIPIEALDWYAKTFSGALIGQNLSDNAEQQFEADPQIPWGTDDKPDPGEGPDTLVVSGDGNGDGVLITWGAPQPFLVNYRTSNITDAWVVFDADDPAVDWPTLQAALNAVHGTVGPEPTASAPESILGRIERYVERTYRRLSA